MMLKPMDRDFGKIVWAALAALPVTLEPAGHCLSPATAFAQEPKMPSAAFERFQFSFFTDPDSARQGLDAKTLAQLEGEERARAEDMLIEYLPDTRAIIGLGVLRSSKVEPRLIQLFEAETMAWRNLGQGWSPYDLIELAKALWLIRPNPRWLQTQMALLASAEDPVQRQTVAEALYVFHDPPALPGLLKALDDPYSLVRYHAARAILALHGLPHETMDPQHMMYRLMSENPVRHEGGKRDLLVAIAGRPISPP